MSTSKLAAALLTAALGTMTMNAIAAPALSPDNPFARESTLPFKWPPLDRIKNEHYVPAMEAGMAEQREEVAAIVNDKAAPDLREHHRRAGALGPVAEPRRHRVLRAQLVEHQSGHREGSDRDGAEAVGAL